MDRCRKGFYLKNDRLLDTGQIKEICSGGQEPQNGEVSKAFDEKIISLRRLARFGTSGPVRP